MKRNWLLIIRYDYVQLVRLFRNISCALILSCELIDSKTEAFRLNKFLESKENKRK